MSEIVSITIDGEELRVNDDMIWGGTFQCQTCNEISHEAVFVAGSIYWDCSLGHQSTVVIYSNE